MTLRIGVIADTHGKLRPEALAALDGSELILHAGDVGAPYVLHALRALAPVVAVRGNNDRGTWAEALAEVEIVRVEEAAIYLLHDLAELAIDPVSAGVQAVVTGHSHRPALSTDRGVTYLNPGSAGPRRFKLPIAVARMDVDGRSVRAELVYLEPS